MFRKRAKKRFDRKYFSKTASRIHKKNDFYGVKRGGICL